MLNTLPTILSMFLSKIYVRLRNKSYCLTQVTPALCSPRFETLCPRNITMQKAMIRLYDCSRDNLAQSTATLSEEQSDRISTSIVNRHGLFKLCDAIARHDGDRRVYEAFVKEINPAAEDAGVATGVLFCDLTCLPLLSETTTIS